MVISAQRALSLSCQKKKKRFGCQLGGEAPLKRWHQLSNLVLYCLKDCIPQLAHAPKDIILFGMTIAKVFVWILAWHGLYNNTTLDKIFVSSFFYTIFRTWFLWCSLIQVWQIPIVFKIFSMKLYNSTIPVLLELPSRSTRLTAPIYLH